MSNQETPIRLVYQWQGDGEGFLLLESDDQRAAEIVNAVHSATTWAELRSSLTPSEDFQLIPDEWEDEPYGPELVFGDKREFYEIDLLYAAEQRLELPTAITEEFGRVAGGMGFGPHTFYREDRIDELKEALRSLGYDLVLVRQG